ncbi:MAG: hypothetical protein IKB13_08800 [Clostridia bacterium]|nr:hypothetical protein [Clostridia bacterium]
MKKLRNFISVLITATAIGLCVLLLLPLQYAGPSPVARFLRLNDGGNFGQSISDSAAIVFARKSGIFDISKNGENGIFIYHLEEDKNTIETYWHLGEGNNRTASYILIKDGVRYQFSMDANKWHFDSSRVCLTDLHRLAKNMARILSDREADTATLATDMNGIFGIDLTKYFNFAVVPTVIRSAMKVFEDESFRQAAGYSFARENFTLQYNFAPADSKRLAEHIHEVTKPAYTTNLQNLVNIAGIAGGLADLIGFDIYDLLFQGELTFSIGAFSGKLIKFTYTNDNKTLSATNRKYGGCQINIESEQLKALLAQYVV